MNMLDLIGHIAYFALFAGLFLLSRRNRVGFLLQAGGSLTWIVLGVLMGLSSVAIWNVGFLGIAVYGWFVNGDENSS